MAVITGGINGGFSGKAGSVVGYYSMGKWIIRGLPKPSKKNKRGTPKQKECRSKFTKTQQFLAHIVPFIRVGYNMYGRVNNITAHNAAKSYIMLNAFKPEGEIDYSKVLVTYGNIPSALDATVQQDDTGLHFSWTDNSKEKNAQSDDQVMLLAYDVKNGIVKATLSGARRKSGKEFLEISKAQKIQNFQVYIAFISDDREQISMSEYLGEVVF